MTTGNTPLTGQQLINAGLAIASSATVLLPPAAALYLTVASGIYNAVAGALSQGRDATEEDLVAALAADDAEKVLGALARAKAVAAGDTSGDAPKS